MSQSTFIKICEIPIAFSRGKKSPFDLAISSCFICARKRDSIKQIKQYLLGRDSLINWWQQWSDDKRTSNGYYIKLEENIIGYFDLSKGGIVKEVNYETSIDACAEFILLEVASILNISLNSAKIDDFKWDLISK